MYTTQGHCVGGEPHYIRYECREFALSVWCRWPHTNRPCVVPANVVDLMFRNKPSILWTPVLSPDILLGSCYNWCPGQDVTNREWEPGGEKRKFFSIRSAWFLSTGKLATWRWSLPQRSQEVTVRGASLMDELWCDWIFLWTYVMITDSRKSLELVTFIVIYHHNTDRVYIHIYS